MPPPLMTINAICAGLIFFLLLWISRKTKRKSWIRPLLILGLAIVGFFVALITVVIVAAIATSEARGEFWFFVFIWPFVALVWVLLLIGYRLIPEST
jgi:hypothetical protein